MFSEVVADMMSTRLSTTNNAKVVKLNIFYDYLSSNPRSLLYVS